MRRLVMVSILGVGFSLGLSTCREDENQPTQNGTSDLENITPELVVEPIELDVGEPQSSRVYCQGLYFDEEFLLDWRFPAPATALTITGGSFLAQVTPYYDKIDLILFSQRETLPDPTDLDLRIKLGNITKTVTYFNSKNTAEDPLSPYVTIQLQRNTPNPGEAILRHKTYSPDNLMSAQLTYFEWNEADVTLQLAGSVVSQWDGGHSVKVDFNVLLGGPSDPFKIENQQTLRHAFLRGETSPSE